MKKGPISAILSRFMDTNTKQTILSWRAPHDPTISRGRTWHVVGGTTVLSAAGYGILSGSWSLAVVALLCGALYFLLRDHAPQEHSIDITPGGLLLDDSFVQWQDIAGFWFLHTPAYTQLHLESARRDRKTLTFLTQNIPVADIRLALGAFIPELTGKRENLIDKIIRLCKL